jgi:hypothetical protein
MAVNINTVYQRVLAIANKEQRGYITPQEFNTLANQAQLDIFEQYFYDINQFSRVAGNSTEHSDMLHILEEKISPFKVNGTTLLSSSELLSQSTFGASNVQFWTDATGNNSVATVVSNANNGYKPSLQLKNDGEDDDPHVYEDVSLSTSKEYRLKVKVSYANDPTGAGDTVTIKLHAYSTSGTNDGEYILSTTAVTGGEYFLDFNPVDYAGGGGVTETYRIAVGLDEDTNDSTIVNFSEISLLEIDNKTLATDLYRLGQVTYKDPGETYAVAVTEANQNELTYYENSPLARPTIKNPVYVRVAFNQIKVYPEPLTQSGRVIYNYIKKPAEVKWTYNVIQGNALYNATASDAQDFELHPAEEKNLVMNILKLAGIMIEDPNLYQAAAQEEVKEIQQEKI